MAQKPGVAICNDCIATRNSRSHESGATFAAVSATFQDFCSPPAVDRSGSGGLVARTATERKPPLGAADFRYDRIVSS
jgi:hypothetical protein